MRIRSLLLLSVLLPTCVAITATAQQTGTLDVPRIISYQGLLSTNDGVPLPNGTYDIIVTLYADEAGTQPLWQGTYNTSVHNGIFNLYLGSGNTPLPSAQQMNRPLWIGTSVNGSPQMLPLTPLAASPYALNLPDRAITTAKLADGAVTAEKMGTPYVAGIALNGKTITGDGAVLNIEVGEGIALTYDEQTKTLKLSKPVAAVQGDGEKGDNAPSVLDVTDASENWLGRNAGANQPFFETPLGTFNTLAGGFLNEIRTEADYSTIAGGFTNVIDTASDWAFIGGGQHNLIESGTEWSTISGGHNNTIYSDHGFIGGGHHDTVIGDASTIAGGWLNYIDGVYSAIAGGKNNRVEIDRSVIGGGEMNSITTAGSWSTIGGGQNNEIANSNGTFIGGGLRNKVVPSGGSAVHHSTIAGGTDNEIYEQVGFIGGGRINVINAFNGTISGGRENTITAVATTGTISGGYKNTVEGLESAIAGGSHNTIWPGAYQSSISGGTANNIRDDVYGSVISGGIGNNIPSGMLTTIPGGDNVIAQGYGQTAFGFFNKYKGTMPFRKAGATLTQMNQPILIIGNGDTIVGQADSRSNAFEVSYNGHSIVFDENGSGGASGTPTPRGAVQGGTYRDNVIYGWADVAANGQLIQECADFGVRQITYYGGGRYRVELRVVGPDGVTPAEIDCGSVVATVGTGAGPSGTPPTNPETCYHIITSSIANNRFDVFITWNDPNLEHCVAKDAPFKFHVTGRVN